MEKPSALLLGTECFRSLYEYSLSWLLSTPLQFVLPRGDGHPVIVLPGLGATDTSTEFIRHFFNNIGYNTHPWGLGRNFGPKHGISSLTNQLTDRISKISREAGNQEVSLIGWSLGGIYAREIAKVEPSLVRQVVTLGTPFKGIENSTHAAALYELLSKDKSHRDPAVLKQIGIPPPVPFTSIYSKTDGVVHWTSSIEDKSHISENIEVPGASHLGLGHNPMSICIIANRLLQTKDTWLHFNR